MFFIVGWRTVDCDDEKGYLNCPTCRSRRAGTTVARKVYLTLFWLAVVPLSTSDTCYRCDGCHELFAAGGSYPFDFGDHPAAKVWECRHCRTANTNVRYRCDACGADA